MIGCDAVGDSCGECCYSLCNILLEGWTEAGLSFFIYLFIASRSGILVF